MIIDRIKNWNLYDYGAVWAQAFDFISSLTEDTADGEYQLQDDKVFARVMSYDTKKPIDAVLETHRKYLDVQTVISGAECIEWFPADALDVDKSYNEETDAQFYVRPELAPARVDVFPGTFVALFTNDAHMPALEVGGKSELIKKAVVKIDLSLLSTDSL